MVLAFCPLGITGMCGLSVSQYPEPCARGYIYESVGVACMILYCCLFSSSGINSHGLACNVIMSSDNYFRLHDFVSTECPLDAPHPVPH